jgi:hypothetical protein
VLDLSYFEQKLAALVGRPTELRPFVCDGSPLDCRVFIVGFNPASASERDFWDFWNPKTGFDKPAWFRNYLQERARCPLKPGKTRRNPVSNTRRVIEWIVSEASPVKFLETNIYSAPTEEAKDLAVHQRLTAPFDFLLDEIKPSLIITHGKEAADYLRMRTPSASVMNLSHLSRGWSESRARELGQNIAREYGDANYASKPMWE